MQTRKQQVAAERRQAALMWAVLIAWLILGLAVKGLMYQHGW